MINKNVSGTFTNQSTQVKKQSSTGKNKINDSNREILDKIISKGTTGAGFQTIRTETSE